MSVLCVCAGCAARQERKYTIEELDNLACIKIYSAEDNELITVISDEDKLHQFNHPSFLEDSDSMDHQDELKKEAAGASELYYFVSYKYPAARFGKKDPVENNTITLYDTDIIRLTVAGDSIKAFNISEEYLTFYYEISEEDMNFYRSLAE